MVPGTPARVCASSHAHQSWPSQTTAGRPAAPETRKTRVSAQTCRAMPPTETQGCTGSQLDDSDMKRERQSGTISLHLSTTNHNERNCVAPGG